MAEDTQNVDGIKNPHASLICKDIGAIQDWLGVDEEILKRRLCERKKKRSRPYPGAPNFVVPVIDDTVREKTTQEMNMMHGAVRYATFIALDPNIDSARTALAEVAFDTYLRYVINAAEKIEEAVDCRNARGHTIVKIIRTEDDRWGTCPDIETLDPRDVILPSATKQIKKAQRITHIIRLAPDELREEGEARGWDSATVEAVIKKATSNDRDKQSGEKVDDAFALVKHLVGVTTSGGENAATVVIWEHWHKAKQWDVDQDPTKRVMLGRKCCTIFSPDAPEDVLAVIPWREDDREEELTQEEMAQEALQALVEQRQPEQTKTVVGKDRPWPFIQPRYENRSKFFYDTRGIGRLCMDDQKAASAQQNAKMVMMDYFQLPIFTGPGTRASTNITYEPGSVIPEDMKPVTMPAIPAQFDFDIELHKRNAARRCGAIGQYEFSGDISSKKRVQKTATEISSEQVRTNSISAADVERFNGPWVELFAQLWEDLRRLKKPLPLIDNNQFIGQQADFYDFDVLIIPSANAKTWNRDLQFQRALTAAQFANGMLKDFGVTLDPQAIAKDILSNWDPLTAARWFFDPAKAKDNMPPVYQLLQQLQEAVGQSSQQLPAIMDAINKIGKMAMKDEARIEKIEEAIQQPPQMQPPRLV